MKDFKNKTVVITGGATGIGFGYAKALGLEGAKVVIAGRRADRLKEAVGQLTALGIDAAYKTCDVTKRNEIENLEQFARDTYGSVDVLMNNAGVGQIQSSLFDTPLDDIPLAIKINFLGAWNVLQVFGKKMIAQGSPCAVYLTGSENSLFNGVAYCSSYVAGKHAVYALATALREEAPEFMTVGLICPGFVFTELIPEETMKMGMPTDEFIQKTMPQIKAGKFYIVSHAYNIERLKEQYSEVKEAYETYAPRYEGDIEYDVRTLYAQVQTTQ